MAVARRLPVVCDVNVLMDALVADDDPATWPSPPPVRGDPNAMTLAVLNEGLEFGLWLSPHVLDGTKRVLARVYGFSAGECEDYERSLTNVARRTGGVVEPRERIADCADSEDDRILELAAEAGAFLRISQGRRSTTALALARRADRRA